MAGLALRHAKECETLPAKKSSVPHCLPHLAKAVDDAEEEHARPWETVYARGSTHGSFTGCVDSALVPDCGIVDGGGATWRTATTRPSPADVDWRPATVGNEASRASASNGLVDTDRPITAPASFAPRSYGTSRGSRGDADTELPDIAALTERGFPWNPLQWLELRQKMLDEGRVKDLPLLMRSVRESTARALQRQYYETENRATTVHLNDHLLPAECIRWLGRSNISVPPLPTAMPGNYVEPPVIVVDLSPLDVVSQLTTASEEIKHPICLAVEISDFDRSGRLDMSTRSGSSYQQNMLVRTDFGRFCRSALSSLHNGSCSVRDHLCAHHDPYVFTCPDVTMFRGPREDGYPFLDTPVHVSAVAYAMPSLRPAVSMHRQAGSLEKTSWYASDLDQTALLERLSLIGFAAMQGFGADTQGILILSAPGCTDRGLHPQDAVANSLRHWRCRFGRLFHTVILACGSDGDLAERFDISINRQVYAALVKETASNFVDWHWQGSIIALHINHADFNEIANLYLDEKEKREIEDMSVDCNSRRSSRSSLSLTFPESEERRLRGVEFNEEIDLSANRCNSDDSRSDVNEVISAIDENEETRPLSSCSEWSAVPDQAPPPAPNIVVARRGSHEESVEDTVLREACEEAAAAALTDPGGQGEGNDQGPSAHQRDGGKAKIDALPVGNTCNGSRVPSKNSCLAEHSDSRHRSSSRVEREVSFNPTTPALTDTSLLEFFGEAILENKGGNISDDVAEQQVGQMFHMARESKRNTQTAVESHRPSRSLSIVHMPQRSVTLSRIGGDGPIARRLSNSGDVKQEVQRRLSMASRSSSRRSTLATNLPDSDNDTLGIGEGTLGMQLRSNSICSTSSNRRRSRAESICSQNSCARRGSRRLSVNSDCTGARRMSAHSKADTIMQHHPVGRMAGTLKVNNLAPHRPETQEAVQNANNVVSEFAATSIRAEKRATIKKETNLVSEAEQLRADTRKKLLERKKDQALLQHANTTSLTQSPCRFRILQPALTSSATEGDVITTVVDLGSARAERDDEETSNCGSHIAMSEVSDASDKSEKEVEAAAETGTASALSGVSDTPLESSQPLASLTRSHGSKEKAKEEPKPKLLEWELRMGIHQLALALKDKAEEYWSSPRKMRHLQLMKGKKAGTRHIARRTSDSARCIENFKSLDAEFLKDKGMMLADKESTAFEEVLPATPKIEKAIATRSQLSRLTRKGSLGGYSALGAMTPRASTLLQELRSEFASSAPSPIASPRSSFTANDSEALDKLQELAETKGVQGRNSTMLPPLSAEGTAVATPRNGSKLRVSPAAAAVNRRCSAMSMRSMVSASGKDSDGQSADLSRSAALSKSKYKHLVTGEVDAGFGGQRKSTMVSPHTRMQTLTDIGEHNLAIM